MHLNKISKTVAVAIISAIFSVGSIAAVKQFQQGSKVEQFVTRQSDGSLVINTTEAGRDIMGYAGNVPLKIVVKNGKIVSVEALKNKETPKYFKMASRILTKWNGLTVSQALNLKVDAVSGATYSSNAIIKNVQAGLKTVPAKKVKSRR